jgi:hypothetical protein
MTTSSGSSRAEGSESRPKARLRLVQHGVGQELLEELDLFLRELPSGCR